MPIHFRCPHCDKLLALGTDKGGTQIHCPLCDRTLTVPPRTVVSVPTTTVLRAEEAATWWLDPPALDVPSQPVAAVPDVAEKPPPAEAWWLDAAPLPAPPSMPLINTPPPLPDVLPGEKPIASPPPRRHVGSVAVFVFLLIGVNVGLLIWYLARDTAPAAEKDATPAAPVDEKRKPASEDGPSKPVSDEDKLTVKHRRDATEEDLRREMALFPEIALDRGNERTQMQRAKTLAEETVQQDEPLEVTARLTADRPDLGGLPLRTGAAARLSAEATERLRSGSLALRARLFEATRDGPRGPDGEARADGKKLLASLTADNAPRGKWLQPESIPALQQLLMGEEEPLRSVLIDQLTRIADPRASIALAQRALFDPHPDLRQRALTALAKRPRAEYRTVLLDGFRYPWSVVADHAAEALTALRLRDTVSALRDLLEQPDPTAPYKVPGKLEPFVREVVRINHLRNCVLCHAPSLSDGDKLRGFVPSPEQAVPPPYSREYYASRRSGYFIRADVTYLQQDFSAYLAVPNPGLWPTAQRYDFLVRERAATAEEIQQARQPNAKETSAHRQAILYAMRELEE